MVGLKKTVTYPIISPKLVNPRGIAGNAEEEEDMVGLKKTVTYAKLSPKIVNPRGIAGNAEEEEDMVGLKNVHICKK